MSVVHSIFPRSTYPENDLNAALVIDNDVVAATLLEKRLRRIGYDVHMTSSSVDGIDWFKNNSVDIIFVAAEYLDDSDSRIINKIKLYFSDAFVPVVVTCRQEHESSLAKYLDAGVDDFIFRPLSDRAFEKRVENLKRLRDMYGMYRYSVQEQEVGKKIHTAAISTRIMDIDPIRSINRSAGVFSGDLILLARKPNGNIHVLLADFTGHGLSAAIGALPVADTFCVMTEKGFKPDVIIRQINRKLYTLLPTSMFMSMALIQISPDLDNVHVWNAGMPHIYLVDNETGKIKNTIESSSIPLGVIEHIDDQVQDTKISIEQGDTFIMHSDGLTECANLEGEMFGVERLEDIINKSDGVDDLFEDIMTKFDTFYGMQELSDDVSLVSVPCVDTLFTGMVGGEDGFRHDSHDHSGSWKWSMELSGASLYDVDPVPVVEREYSKLLSQPVSVMDLHNVLSEMYKNALEYGVFRKARKDIEREHRCNRDDETNANLLDGCYVRLEIEMIQHGNKPALYLKVEDSGRGFDHANVMLRLDEDENDVSLGYGLSLVNSICDSIQFNDAGNCIEAIITG